MIVITRRTARESIKAIENRKYSVVRNNAKWVDVVVFEVRLFGLFLIFKSKKEINS